MTLSLEQVEVLQQIGIPIWQQRAVETESFADPVNIAEFDHTALNWICVPDVTLPPQQGRLLQSILRSVGIDLDQTAIINLAQLTSALDKSSAHHKIIIFDISAVKKLNDLSLNDDAVTVKLPTSALLSVTHSLTTLLEQPPLKKHTWLALKRLYLA